jgi:succinoglycan biosynthesis protein ExoA
MISVVCPIYNEIGYIDKVIDFCQNAAPVEKEIFLVDGGSTDGTIERIRSRIKDDVRFHLLDNPDKYVPAALNKAIRLAKGDIIVRLDAHSEYAPDYFSAIIKTFEETDAEIVGGSMRIASGSNLQDAIGYATSTIFGVGDSSFHYEDFEGYTDTVYLGSWKRKIFETTGLFDESMKRNQDDEFHYRAKSKGFRLYQSPAIKVYYHPRNSYKKLFSQYYQYGLYKPLVLRKVKSEVKLRHFVPTAFALYFMSLLLFTAIGFYYAWALLGLYAIIDVFFCIKSKRNFRVSALILPVYPVLHLGYGLGFLMGILSPKR